MEQEEANINLVSELRKKVLRTRQAQVHDAKIIFFSLQIFLEKSLSNHRVTMEKIRIRKYVHSQRTKIQDENGSRCACNLHFWIKMEKDFHRQTWNANSMKIFVIYVSTLRSYRVMGNVDKRFGYCNFAIYPISCISYCESTCIIRASISSFYFIINSV